MQLPFQHHTIAQQIHTHTHSAMQFMQQLFATFDGHLHVQFWDGQCVSLGQQPMPAAGSPFRLVFKTPAVIQAFIKRRDPICFAESYFMGEIDVIGDLSALLAMRDQFEQLRMDWRARLLAIQHLWSAWRTPTMTVPKWHRSYFFKAEVVESHSRAENMAAVQFHYDVSNDFYRLWLDPAMVYSCAYFADEQQSLAQAQFDKLDLICRKLQLKPGERLLDIGCGWGALILHAAQYYGVTAHGVTLSQRQYDAVNAHILSAGLQAHVSVALQDYRDISGHAQYDKIASIGMFEHVGIAQLPVYFATMQRLLAPDGMVLNHGITSEQAGWGDSLGKTFINRYVFPDGQLDTIVNIQQHMALAEFEIIDLESMREHYALTLRHWVKRLMQQHHAALQHVNEATYRVWLAYMTASAQAFSQGRLGIYQILLRQRGASAASLPLRRQHMMLSSH